jgi:hypothetical protein
VPIFKSSVYQRGVEFSLSKALVQQIEANTPYKVVPRERADTILEGEIVEVHVNTLSNDRFSAIPQEQLFDIIVDFTWKDLRTGKILVERRGIEQTSSYYPTLGEGRATGTQTRQRAVSPGDRAGTASRLVSRRDLRSREYVFSSLPVGGKPRCGNLMMCIDVPDNK